MAAAGDRSSSWGSRWRLNRTKWMTPRPVGFSTTYLDLLEEMPKTSTWPIN